MSPKVSLSCLAAVWLLCSTPGDDSQQPQFRSQSLGVAVDVLVTDGRKPVNGLSAADFELRDNGVVQTVELVVADVPLNVLLVLDTSASIEGTRQTSLNAATDALLSNLKSADAVSLTTFSHAVTRRIPLSDRVFAIRDALSAVRPAGRTAVLDALYVALTATIAQSGRFLVVAYTDGADVSSWLRPSDIIETTKRSNAVVYIVTPADARRAPSLEEIANATGGEMLRVSSDAELQVSFGKVLDQFRSRYVLVYTPAGTSLSGFHRLSVRVKRRGLTVRARPGYIGVESPR